MLDASRIHAGLYQGSAPRSAREVLGEGFTVVVFAAYEVQPPDHVLRGLEALRCPLVDDYERLPSRDDWQRALDCAEQAVRRLEAGKRVLVTCAQGRNRSGLISAMALVHSGWRSLDAVRRIQGCRLHALTNPQFVRALTAWLP